MGTAAGVHQSESRQRVVELFCAANAGSTWVDGKKAAATGRRILPISASHGKDKNRTTWACVRPA